MNAFQRLLVAAPAAALLPVALAPVSGLANDLNLDLDTVQEYSISQGASIRDFSDVYPTDWAYQALSELVETYGCVGGYPDGTFRGQQPITRFEMAAILNSCLEAMSAKMDMMEDDPGVMEDMETMDRLTASFEEELITLKGTVDGLDARVSTLEENSQFSTTTKTEFKIATDFVYLSTEDEEARKKLKKKVDKKDRIDHEAVTVSTNSQMLTVESRTLTVESRTLTVDAQMLTVDAQMLTVDAQVLTVGGHMITVDAQMITVGGQPITIASQSVPLAVQVIPGTESMIIGANDGVLTHPEQFVAGGKYSDFGTDNTSEYILVPLGGDLSLNDDNEIVDSNLANGLGITPFDDLSNLDETTNLVLIKRPESPSTGTLYADGELTSTITDEAAQAILDQINESLIQMTDAEKDIILNPSKVTIPMTSVMVGTNLVNIPEKTINITTDNTITIEKREISIPSSEKITISDREVSDGTVTITTIPLSYDFTGGTAGPTEAIPIVSNDTTYYIQPFTITGNPEQIVIPEQKVEIDNNDAITVESQTVTVEGLSYIIPEINITTDRAGETVFGSIPGVAHTTKPSVSVDDPITTEEQPDINITKTTIEIPGEMITVNGTIVTLNPQTVTLNPQTVTVDAQMITVETQMITVDSQTLMVDAQTLTVDSQTLTVDSQMITVQGYHMVEGTEMVANTSDNSGLALTSSAEVAFTTSFSGSDKLTFKLKGDVMSMGHHYLALGNVYDVADNGHTNVKFTGFTYENSFGMGGDLMGNVVFGTDYDDLAGVAGMDTYYGGGGYDGYGAGDFGDTGIGFNMELFSSAAGALTASASYAVAGDHASSASYGMEGYPSMEMGLFGEDTDRSGVLALSWEGALFGGNDALFTLAYQNIKNNMMMEDMDGMMMSNDLTRSYFHLVAGAYFTDTISLSGSFSFGEWDYEKMKDMDSGQWMVALNMDDAFFPGNSTGIAVGTPEFVKDVEGMDPTRVLELYYSFKVNDNFKVPVYLDFFSNAGNPSGGNGTDSNAFGIKISPTLNF